MGQISLVNKLIVLNELERRLADHGKQRIPPPPPLPPAFCMTLVTAMCHVFHKQENGFVTTARIIP